MALALNMWLSTAASLPTPGLELMLGHDSNASAPELASESDDTSSSGRGAAPSDSGERRQSSRERTTRMFAANGFFVQLVPLGGAIDPYCCYGSHRYAWSVGFGHLWRPSKRLGVGLSGHFLHSTVIFGPINAFHVGPRVRVGGVGSRVFGYGLTGLDFATFRNFEERELVLYYAYVPVGGGVMGAVGEHVSLGAEADIGFRATHAYPPLSFDIHLFVAFHWSLRRR